MGRNVLTKHRQDVKNDCVKSRNVKSAWHGSLELRATHASEGPKCALRRGHGAIVYEG